MKSKPKMRDLNELTTLDEFLDEEGINAETTLRAVKRVIAMQLDREMRRKNMTKAQLAQRMRTSRAQIDRVLDPKQGNVTLDTLARAAKMVGRSLKLELA